MKERWERVTLHHVAVPLLAPFGASHGTEERREVVLIEVQGADGCTGWGECDALSRPTYTHEYAAGAYRLLRDLVVPACLAGDDGAAALLRHHPMARAGLAFAQADLDARREGRSLAAQLGAGRERLARTVVVGQHACIEDLLAAVEAAVVSGAALVKLKLGSDEDRRAIAAVRSTFEGLALAADANGAFDGVAAAELAWVDALGLRYLEQPYPADDLLATAAAVAVLDTPVALDESVTSLAGARLAHAVGALGARGAVNIKPARVGGPVAALDLARWAADLGIPAFCGGMLELGIGRAAAVAVAASDLLSWPTDLGPSSQYFAEDITDRPVNVDEAGNLVVPIGPGIGVQPDGERLARATVAAATMSATGVSATGVSAAGVSATTPPAASSSAMSGR